MRRLALVAAAAVASCGGHGADAPPPSTPPPAAADATATATATAAPARTPDPSTGNVGDAPEISRSAGTATSVVVLWPRISPKESANDPAARVVAAKVQQRLASLVARAAPGTTVDVRPEPERVCPRYGCTGASVGVALFAKGRSCAAVALVSPPGKSPQYLVGWAGLARIAQSSVPFRQPPESQISVDDFAECDHIDDALAPHDAQVVQAIQDARRP